MKITITTPYINTKIVGIDGNALVFRGIKNRTRCFDQQIRADGNTVEMYAFYSVPNGCKEYALRFGEGDTDVDGVFHGYFLVKN